MSRKTWVLTVLMLVALASVGALQLAVGSSDSGLPTAAPTESATAGAAETLEAGVTATSPAAPAGTATSEGELVFDDIEAQTERFVAYQRTITLTAEQEAIKKEALEALPAPCCADNTAYTCCCPCNLSRSTWGLSNYLITERGADVEEVRSAASRWIEAVNPKGFSGDVCYTAGGCPRPFEHNGCGGMNPNQITWAD